MIVKIDKLSHDFKGIAKINGKVTFISNALPGEIVECKIEKEKKDINFGKVVSYISESSDRNKPLCPFYSLCGGCDTSHIKYEKALEYKKENVIDILKKYSGLDINPLVVSDYNLYNYRNKITLRVLNGKLALTSAESNDLVNIDKCNLVNNNINKIIAKLNTMNLKGIKEIVIKGTYELMVIISASSVDNSIISSLKDLVSSIIINKKKVYGNDYITMNIGKYKYAVYPESFFQINTEMISKLYDKVKEYAGCGENLLDLYCGAGTIGIYLSSNYKQIYGVEINKDAVRGANFNKKLNNIDNISFECKSLDKFNIKKVDTAVVDPPRNGLDKITINNLINSNIEKIVYVSCNPITLARDLNILKDKYELKDITLFDMFPNTKHVECACVLHLKTPLK